MPRLAQPVLDLCRELDLGHACREHFAHAICDSADHGRGLANAIELPRALQCSLITEEVRAVDDVVAVEPTDIVEIPGGGQHVELEPDAPAADAALGERGRELPERAHRLDASERALGLRALERSTHEQQGLACGGNDQVRVLCSAPEVVEIGSLNDHGSVELCRQQTPLKTGEALRDLGRRHARNERVVGHRGR